MRPTFFARSLAVFHPTTKVSQAQSQKAAKTMIASRTPPFPSTNTTNPPTAPSKSGQQTPPQETPKFVLDKELVHL
ncbi:hypothetical protein HDU98_011007 [Podochytrium sp. JEL0797]|nr:hypothetical protein HDU98_011007 [Podochytrium sp. JEL0797]